MSTWESLVAGAVQGTSRRPPDLAAWLADLEDLATLAVDPPRQLLTAAALATGLRRGGGRAGVAPVPAPGPSDPRPAVAGGLFQDAPLDLQREFFAEVAHGGMRLHPSDIPAAFDLAVRGAPADRPLESDIVIAAGPLGQWLAAQNPEWASLVSAPESSTRPAGAGDAGEVSLDSTLWREGTASQRLAWLAALRRSDPATALGYLTPLLTTAKEQPAFRARAILLLQGTLHPGEEELLEASLDARAGDVRAAAAQALAWHPGSALTARMHERFRRWLRPDPDTGGILITVPVELAPDEVRDGIDVGAHRRESVAARQARWLVAVCAPFRLRDWREHLPGLDPSRPPELTGVPPALIDGFYTALVASVRRARSSEWADALLTAALLADASATWPWEPLAPLASPALRDEITRAVLSGRVSEPAGKRWFHQMPFPVPDDLCRELIAALGGLANSQFGVLIDRLGREQPPTWSAELFEVAVRLPSRRGSAVLEASQWQERRAELRRALEQSRPANSSETDPDASASATSSPHAARTPSPTPPAGRPHP
ncbi:MAG: DUF5691 domain-containing protein [Actinomycetales bacterium]